jgi:hypothetical protein
MNKVAPTDSILDSVRVEDVMLYLQERGWQPIEHQNKRLLLFRSPKHDEGKQIVLGVPEKNDFIDTRVRLAETINSLSILEALPAKLIARKIQSMKADILNMKVVGQLSEFNSLPLTVGARLIQDFRVLLGYAACVEENPTPYFVRATGVAAKFANECRLGQTFAGSFGFSLEVPIAPKTEDGSLPFERRVTQRIVRGLRNLQDSVSKDDISIIVKNYEEGFNANMFEVLSNIAASFEGIELEYSTLWSPRWSVATDIAEVQPICLDARSFEFVGTAARELRQVEESREVEIKGQVIQLKAEDISERDDLDEEPLSVHEIIIRRDEPEQKAIRVQVTLGLDDYRVACDAHRDGRKVIVRGKLEKPGKRYQLMSPSGFKTED